ncbi:hypothetical protein BKA70DRAFT_1425558 [Coprinopsis sp. MPI-PUGE-AT-0042]|nr:hypothetical protein BKA70DRAFT_1425558 [Coprinopsis sp. MPI-PUGE-AT-0042]
MSIISLDAQPPPASPTPLPSSLPGSPGHGVNEVIEILSDDESLQFPCEKRARLTQAPVYYRPRVPVKVQEPTVTALKRPQLTIKSDSKPARPSHAKSGPRAPARLKVDPNGGHRLTKRLTVARIAYMDSDIPQHGLLVASRASELRASSTSGRLLALMTGISGVRLSLPLFVYSNREPKATFSILFREMYRVIHDVTTVPLRFQVFFPTDPTARLCSILVDGEIVQAQGLAESLLTYTNLFIDDIPEHMP